MNTAALIALMVGLGVGAAIGSTYIYVVTIGKLERDNDKLRALLIHATARIEKAENQLFWAGFNLVDRQPDKPGVRDGYYSSAWLDEFGNQEEVA